MIQFYEPGDDFGYLSNFSDHSILLDGAHWPTAEHFYQSRKFDDAELRAEVLHCKSPQAAFELSRKLARFVAVDWDSGKLIAMRETLRAKFTQHPALARQLFETGDVPVVEASPTDAFWGIGPQGTGANMLGNLLMKLRTSLNGAFSGPIDEITKAILPTEFGVFHLYSIRDVNGAQHAALAMGVTEREGLPVRIHSECLTGDAFGSLRCDCGSQLRMAMGLISREGRGVLIYLRQEGRGIGLFNKVRAYHLQDNGHDTVEANLALGFAADERTYEIASAILEFFGSNTISLMTNNPQKVAALEKQGLVVKSRIPIVTAATSHNSSYLHAKAALMGHMFELEQEQK